MGRKFNIQVIGRTRKGGEKEAEAILEDGKYQPINTRSFVNLIKRSSKKNIPETLQDYWKVKIKEKNLKNSHEKTTHYFQMNNVNGRVIPSRNALWRTDWGWSPMIPVLMPLCDPPLRVRQGLGLASNQKSKAEVTIHNYMSVSTWIIRLHQCVT